MLPPCIEDAWKKSLSLNICLMGISNPLNLLETLLVNYIKKETLTARRPSYLHN